MKGKVTSSILVIGSVNNEENQTQALDETVKPSWKDVAKNLAFIAITIGIAYFITVKIGIENVRDAVDSGGALGPVIFIILKATSLVVVPIGGAPLYPIAGAVFGFSKGLLFTIIGDTLGSTIAFYLSRMFGRSILRFFMSRQHFPIIEKLLSKGSETKTFLKARIFFAGFPDLFAYAAGLTKISFPVFIVIHVGLHAIGVALLVAFGDVLVSGNKLAMLGTSLVVTVLALAGIFWFHADLKKSA